MNISRRFNLKSKTYIIGDFSEVLFHRKMVRYVCDWHTEWSLDSKVPPGLLK